MSDFEDTLNALLVSTFDTILKYESASLADLPGPSVTIAEAHMIEFIAGQDGQATGSSIATGRHLALPTVTVAVKKMEQKGYIRKVRSTQDGRRIYVHLTEQGMRINRAHSLMHQRMVRHISNQFSPDQKDTLLTAVQQLSDFFLGLAGGRQ
ncbi:MAG: MarR family transcriptional regulator [Propionibacteriaceae bacterium]|nr:MarR family transcriptional regulator [Propionibacteriaceae bacterium]